MTAAQLRSLTTAGPVLSCSPVVFVAPDGRRFELHTASATVPHAEAEDGTRKPAGVPVLTLTLKEVHSC